MVLYQSCYSFSRHFVIDCLRYKTRSNNIRAYTSKGKTPYGYKPDLHKVSKTRYNKAKKVPKSIKKVKGYRKKLVLIGIWLHVLQDRWSHGLKSEKIKHERGKNNRTDNYMYDYNKKTKKYKKYSYKKLLKKNKRLIHTVNDTRKYLKVAKKELNKEKLPNNQKRVGKQKNNINQINKKIVSYLKQR